MSRRPGDVCENARLADRLALERLRPFDDHSNLGTLRQVHRRRKLNLPVLDDTNHFQHRTNSIIREAFAPVPKKPAPEPGAILRHSAVVRRRFAVVDARLP